MRSKYLSYPKDYWFPKPVRTACVIVLVLGISWAIATPNNIELINPYGWPQFVEFFQAALRPDLSSDFLSIAIEATWVTLSYAILGTLFSLVLGSIGAIFTSQTVVKTLFPKLYTLKFHLWCRLTFSIPRSLHEVIWGLLFINIVGLDPIAGVLAITIPYGAIVAKVFSEILDDTPTESLDNLRQSGCNPIAAIAYGLLPRAQLSLISYAFYRFECSLRSAAILGIIGAGGLGYQMMLSLQSLRYSQIWTLFYAIFILNGSVDCISAFVRNWIGSPKRLELKSTLKTVQSHKQAKSSHHLCHLLLSGSLVVSLGAIAWNNLQPNPHKLVSRAILQDLTSRSTSISIWGIESSFIQRIPWLSLQTLAMSILGIAIAATGAFCLAWFAARSYGKPDLQTQLSLSQKVRVLCAHSILLFFRAIPSPIWALVMLYIFRPGIIVGAIALGIHNVGVMGRLFSEDLEDSESHALQPITQSGIGHLSKVAYGLIPSIIKRVSHYSSYRWEVCIRESLILSLVGGGGLGILLKEEISNFSFEKILQLLLIFCFLTILAEIVNHRCNMFLYAKHRRIDTNEKKDSLYLQRLD